MSVKIHNLLSSELFNDAEVAAGINGLNNEIKRINFSDCPMPDDIVKIDLIEKGDLFINSLYDIKGEEDKLFKLFEIYIFFKCAGTFVITEYINELPQKVIDLCNDNNFPVIFIDPDIPYAEIIKTTTEMILADKLDTISEMRIEKLLNDNIDKKTIIETANDLNKNFKNYYASVYVKFTDSSDDKVMQLFNSNVKKLNNIESIKFKNGLFLIINYDTQSILNSVIDNIELLIKRYYENYNIGVSNEFSEISQFNHCIKQALLSTDISSVINKSLVHYKDTSIYKILYLLKGTDALKDFYDEIMKPLLDYDNNKFELIKTIEAYLDNDGDCKKTARFLNQHENTVRYRIQKAKRILHMENNPFKFIEQVSIALRIKNIIDVNR